MMRARPATGQFRPRRSAVKNGHQNPEKLSQRRQDRQGSEFRLLIFGSLRWNLWFFFAAFAIFAREFSGLRRTLLLRFVLLLPRPREDAGQRVVALVARVLVDVVVCPAQRHFTPPRLRVRRTVLDGELVEDFFLADAGEALGDFAGRRQIEPLLDAV